MTATTKVLLGAGVTGVAAFLLWRFWPRKDPDYYPPYEEQYFYEEEMPFEETTPVMHHQTLTPQAGTAAPRATWAGGCLPGYEVNPATGECHVPVY